MLKFEFSSLIKSLQRVWNAPRPMFLLTKSLTLTLLLAASFGCAPSSSTDGDGKPDSSASGNIPEITEETIRERIIGTRVRQVPEENGTGEPISWGFDEDEPKEIVVVEKQVEGATATIVLDIKTGSAPRSREPRSLAGQIRTQWTLETGWVLRRWEIVRIENVSMKYKNLPKPSPESNSNR